MGTVCVIDTGDDTDCLRHLKKEPGSVAEFAKVILAMPFILFAVALVLTFMHVAWGILDFIAVTGTAMMEEALGR